MSAAKEGWSDFGGSERDYAVAYGSAEGCINPSRRLLAWRRGLEDFAILDACRRQMPDRNLRAQALSFIRDDKHLAPDYDEKLSDLIQSCAG